MFNIFMTEEYTEKEKSDFCLVQLTENKVGYFENDVLKYEHITYSDDTEAWKEYDEFGRPILYKNVSGFGWEKKYEDDGSTIFQSYRDFDQREVLPLHKNCINKWIKRDEEHAEGKTTFFDSYSFVLCRNFDEESQMYYEIEEVSNYSWKKEYEQEGKVCLFTDSNGYKYVVHKNGGVMLFTDSKGIVWRKEFDKDGNLRLFVDANGIETRGSGQMRGVNLKTLQPTFQEPFTFKEEETED